MAAIAGAPQRNVARAREDLLDVVGSGIVKFHIDRRYPLEQVCRSACDLEARKTTGSKVLIP